MEGETRPFSLLEISPFGPADLRVGKCGNVRTCQQREYEYHTYNTVEYVHFCLAILPIYQHPVHYTTGGQGMEILEVILC